MSFLVSHISTRSIHHVSLSYIHDFFVPNHLNWWSIMNLKKIVIDNFVVIKNYFVDRQKAQKTKCKLNNYYGESDPLTSTVYKLFGYFHSGHVSKNDTEHCWDSITTAENIKNIHDMVIEDTRLKVCVIANAICISNDQFIIFYMNIYICKRCLKDGYYICLQSKRFSAAVHNSRWNLNT